MSIEIMSLWYNTGVNHIKSDGALERRRHPFSTCEIGTDTMSDHTRVPFFPENLNDYAPWVAKHGLAAPYGECQCGCGQKTTIALLTNRMRLGHLAGHPVRYIIGHYNGAKQTLEEAFWQYVTPGNPDACWEWQGHREPNGYGVLRYSVASKLQIKAHRVSYELHYGPILDGLFVCHVCDNRCCVNPAHLFAGTDKDNYDDMVAKGRQNPAFSPKISDAEYIVILGLHKAGMNNADIARQYGVSWSTIARVLERVEKYGIK